MEYIIEKRTGNKLFIKDFTTQNKEKYAENLVNSGYYLRDTDPIEVSKDIAIGIINATQQSLIKEKEEYEAYKLIEDEKLIIKTQDLEAEKEKLKKEREEFESRNSETKPQKNK